MSLDVNPISELLTKCHILYDDCLISSERIIESYLSFFADTMNPTTRKVGFTLHTGSVCFDVAALVAVAMGCLAFNLATNDDIIDSLRPGDMVIYKGQRYRWQGKEKRDGRLYIKLEQDGTKKNGLTTSWVPYEKYKHMVRPYYGEAQKTGGSGVKHKTTNREDFLSSVFSIPVSEIPTQIDVSVAVVCNRSTFADICSKVKIEYNEGKQVGLLDVVPASYYTGLEKEYVFGHNPTKAEPVLKVTGNISVAREIVLNKSGNKTIGLMAFGETISTRDTAELSDLLRRKSLRFALVSSPIYSTFRNQMLELDSDAALFACSKEYLKTIDSGICYSNQYTEELHEQTTSALKNRILPTKVKGSFSPENYTFVRNALEILRQAEWEEELKNEFIVTAYGVLKLLNTAVFSMEEMELAIEKGWINQSVRSPKGQVDRLWEITGKVDQLESVQTLCMEIADLLEAQFNEMLMIVPKAETLVECIKAHEGPIAVVVPKAYYADLLWRSHPELFSSRALACVTPNRFDAEVGYKTVIVVGEIANQKFDVNRSIVAKNVLVLLYACEEKAFSYYKKKQDKFDYELNVRLGLDADLPVPEPEKEEDESEMQRFSSFDEFIENYSMFDIMRLAVGSGQSSGDAPVSEVTHVGHFVSGEQILFSKYYSGVVYDDETATVNEKSPDKLCPGDVIVFTIRNDYTRNIVDTVYERLLSAGLLGKESVGMYEKSQYWREALREYKQINRLSYRDLTDQLQSAGGSIHEVTVRQWLIEDSHIVGPRDLKSLELIGKVTQDPFIFGHEKDYFLACKYVRHERREILKMIANAISNKLMGYLPKAGSVLEIVYDNVENLSETKELEDITELDEVLVVSSSLVNRPITASEVSM